MSKSISSFAGQVLVLFGRGGEQTPFDVDSAFEKAYPDQSVQIADLFGVIQQLKETGLLAPTRVETKDEGLVSERDRAFYGLTEAGLLHVEEIRVEAERRGREIQVDAGRQLGQGGALISEMENSRGEARVRVAYRLRDFVSRLKRQPEMS